MTADRTPPLLTLPQMLQAALAHIEAMPHGDNCYVSRCYVGDPGNRCNCGKEAIVRAIEDTLSAAPPAAPQTAWFVELQSDGVFKGWLSVDGDIECGWTTDPNRAIKFASKADADMARRRWKFLMDRHSTRHLSTEHIWLDAPAAPQGDPPGALELASIKRLHPDDIAVDRFAAALKEKLAQKRDEGRSGWDDKDACPPGTLARMLHEHLPKGDPLDIGNFAMMLWNRGERCNTPAAFLEKP